MAAHMDKIDHEAFICFSPLELLAYTQSGLELDPKFQKCLFEA